MNTSPTLVTPNIGAATGTSLSLTGDLTAKHVVGVSGTPTVTWGAGAGNSPAGTSITGKDLGGYITLTPGGFPGPTTNGMVARITFDSAYSNPPSSIVLSAGTYLAGRDLDRIWVTNITTTYFEIWSSSTALSAGTNYGFYYMVIE
jgi:hypothetical protein